MTAYFGVINHQYCTTPSNFEFLHLQIVTRRQNIHEKSEKRRELLEESRKLQQFEKEADETKAWINEKLKIATDESYKVEYTVQDIVVLGRCSSIFHSVY